MRDRIVDEAVNVTNQRTVEGDFGAHELRVLRGGGDVGVGVQESAFSWRAYGYGSATTAQAIRQQGSRNSPGRLRSLPTSC